MEQKDLDILKFIYQSEEKLKGIEKRMTALEQTIDSRINQVVGKQDWMCKICDDRRETYNKKLTWMLIGLFGLSTALIGKGLVWGIELFRTLHP